VWNRTVAKTEALFERVKPVLMIFGERTVFVGHEIGHAAGAKIEVRTTLFRMRTLT
jgi:3-hydroxyisobutyrate dehydrogenase-like beta-hydroxyacid dehydrogenase